MYHSPKILLETIKCFERKYCYFYSPPWCSKPIRWYFFLWNKKRWICESPNDKIKSGHGCRL